MLPLNQRKEDIADLIGYYWNFLSQELGIKSALAPMAKTALENYSYPGNVRELKNMLERLIVLTPDNGRVDVMHLPKEVVAGGPVTGVTAAPAAAADHSEVNPAVWKPGVAIEAYLEAIEESVIAKAFELSDHNQVQAADLLGLNRGTLQYKIKKYNLVKKKAA